MKDKLIELIKFSLNDKTNYINRVIDKDSMHYKYTFGVHCGKIMLNDDYSGNYYFINKDGKEVGDWMDYRVEFDEIPINNKKEITSFNIDILFKTEPSIFIRSERVIPDGETIDTLITGFRNRIFWFGKDKIDGIHKVSYIKLKHTIKCGNFDYEIDEKLMVEFYELAVENGKRFQDQEYLDVINDRLQKYKDR